MIRKFVLINSNGSRLNLNDLNSFGYSPEGLGVSFTNEYYGANGNFIPNSVGVDRQDFTIHVLLGAENGSSYQEFTKLVEFLNYPPYAIEYSTDSGTWLRDSQLKSLPKTELNEWNVLDQKLEFEFFTPWYRWIIGGNNNEDNDSQNRGKIYLNSGSDNNKGFYTYGYVYGQSHDNTSGDGYFTIKNESQYFNSSNGSPTEIKIIGPAVNPHWEIYNGTQLIQSDGYFINVPEGYELIVSSIPQNQRAVLVGPTGDIESAYQSQDLTRSNFVTIPVGQVTVFIDSGGSKYEWRVREERLVV